ncbi:hypothetical protein [Endozoicomonas sp. 2B-B]
MKYLILPLIIFLVGCAGQFTGYAGIDMHATQFDYDPYDMKNPIGRFGVRYQPEGQPVEVHCEHLSSIPDTQDGKGLNKCGVAVLVDLF